MSVSQRSGINYTREGMDNQDSNSKKRPFGRDDRGGRSFFRARREGAFRSDDHRDGEEAERPERSVRRGDKPARYNNNNKEKRDSRDDKPRYGAGGGRGRRDDRDGQRDDRRYGDRSAKKEDYKKKPRFDSPRGGDKHDRPSEGRRMNDRERRSKYAEAAQAMPDEMRLNRFIAISGVCSRREADRLIEAGEVTVNGVRVDQLGAKVRPGRDEVRLGGELLKGERKVYIVLNKPKGYVTTVEDPHADRTVMDLLKGECPERVYPVGRLDKNTTGVLLLTNDGNLTRELTHPSFAKKKIYHVFLDKACTEQDLERLVEGIELEDGPIHADEVNFVEGNRKEVGIELHSGRNRIVRRMFESLGYEVVKLDRVYFAGLTKMGLRRGFWRYLTPREVGILKAKSYD